MEAEDEPSSSAESESSESSTESRSGAKHLSGKTTKHAAKSTAVGKSMRSTAKGAGKSSKSTVVGKGTRAKGKGRLGADGKGRTMKIQAQLLPTGERFPLRLVTPDTRVHQLKANLEIDAGLPSHLQRLAYLDDGSLLCFTLLSFTSFFASFQVFSFASFLFVLCSALIALLQALLVNCSHTWLLVLLPELPSDFHTMHPLEYPDGKAFS